ncbi:hypothetical protein [Paenibacillus amylolyticus]|uniref:Uncharacterized protein n=1 Tax=Paenibacillus amylolyticus TaxID=1451 RepID=A0ABD8B2S9_PAEAM
MDDSTEEEKKMIKDKQVVQKTIEMKDADILKIAKQGASKYRGTLDKLSKN